jgi:hypothetical protein
MSNSGMVSYTRISPNKSVPRNHAIDKITIHHAAGTYGLYTLGKIFADPARKASSNYGIDNAGAVGMFVQEKDKAWTSFSSSNDNRAVTIEVCNSAVGGDWPVSTKAYAALIKLCVDICRRNGIKKLTYTGTTAGNLTEHRMFKNTLCPGPYLHNRMGAIASAVNEILNPTAYLVRVTASSLNIRTGPGTNYPIVGKITDKGVYTITPTGNGWGKLKSGVGYISLYYTKRI